MNRPWKIWLIFAVCSAVLLAVMLWVSLTASRLARAQAQAQRQAEREEKVRLALWRMDSMLAPLIAQESARPYFAYSAFYPAERALGKMSDAPGAGETLVASPLLTQVSSNILLHFQLDARRRLTSPQVPEGNQRQLAERQLAGPGQIEAAAARLRELQQLLAQPASPELLRLAQQAAAKLPAPGEPRAGVNSDALLALAPAPLPRAPVPAMAQSRGAVPRSQAARRNPLAQSTDQMARTDLDLEARAQSVQQAMDVNLFNNLANAAPPNRANLIEEMLKPVWLGNTLLLVRRVQVQGQEYLQGCWLNWPGLSRWLLESIQDLLPAARLEPLPGKAEDPQGHTTVTLPVRLAPGPAVAAGDALRSPLLLALSVAWLCVLLAGGAVALLLHGTLALSERRAAFVSAVTHELRTPLTTFKMYSEMLALGMVPDEAKRRDYLARLCAEADRLHHLVENVLAYARLERGSARSRVEPVALRELVSRVKPRLDQRAEQAGLALQAAGDEAVLAMVVRVDVAAVEQILFNLVDNACKYAAPAAGEKVIHLEARSANARLVTLRVRDHGPGISTEQAKRLFQPFSKSAQEAAVSAPGVGLGLALCRRLARSLGGDLRFNPAVTGGACFELLLPRMNAG